MSKGINSKPFYENNILHYIYTQTVPKTLEEKEYLRFIGYDSLEASFQVIVLAHLLNKLREYWEYSDLDLLEITIKNVSDKVYLLTVKSQEQKNLLIKAIKSGDLKELLEKELCNTEFIVTYKSIFKKIRKHLKKEDNKTYQQILEKLPEAIIDFYKEFKKIHPELKNTKMNFIFSPEVIVSEDNPKIYTSKISELIKEGIENNNLDIINTSAIRVQYSESFKIDKSMRAQIVQIIKKVVEKHYSNIQDNSKKNELTEALEEIIAKKRNKKDENEIKINIPFAIRENTKKGLNDTKQVYRVYIRFQGKPYKYKPQDGVYTSGSTCVKFPKYITDAYMYMFLKTNIVKNISQSENIVITPIFTHTTLEEVREITERREEFELELNKHLFGKKMKVHFAPESTIQTVILHTVLSILNTARVYTHKDLSDKGLLECIGGLAIVYDDNGDKKMLKYATDLTVNLRELSRITPEIDKLIYRRVDPTKIGIFEMYLRIMRITDSKFKNLKHGLSELIYMYLITGDDKYLTKIPVKIIHTLKTLGKKEKAKYTWLINDLTTMTKTITKHLQNKH